MDLENEGVEPELENLVANPDAVSTAGVSSLYMSDILFLLILLFFFSC